MSTDLAGTMISAALVGRQMWQVMAIFGPLSRCRHKWESEESSIRLGGGGLIDSSRWGRGPTTYRYLCLTKLVGGQGLVQVSSRSWFEGLDCWRERRLGAGISVPTGRGNLTPADVDDRILNRLDFLFPRRCVAFICLIG